MKPFRITMFTRLAMLAAALCLAFPALPVPAADPPPGGISIASFTDDATRPLKAGDILHVTLAGSRNGRAEFAIPGIAEKVTMREAIPGTYTGTYTVHPGVSVSGAALIGSLSYPGIRAPLVGADRPLTLDSVAPRTTTLSPDKGTTVGTTRPLISAALSDGGGVGVDPAATQLYLDGLAQTRQARVTGAAISLTPAQPLAPGVHGVRVVAADRLGNQSTTEWRFSVAPDGLAQAFTCSAAPGRTVGVGQTLRFTLQAQPGGRATVSVGDITADIPLAQGKSGLYTGEYTMRPGDDAPDAPVVAHFRSSGGRTVTLPLPSGITFAAGPPRAPRITYPPIDDFLVGDTLQLEGFAPPGATVRVSLDYVTTALGGLFPIRGTAGVQEVTTDGRGRWRVDRVSLALTSLLVRDQNTVFTISAVTVARSGDVSAPATVTARHG